MSLIELKQLDVEPVAITLQSALGDAPLTAVNLTGATSIRMSVTTEEGVEVFALSLGAGLTITSAVDGRISAAFTAEHTANVAVLRWCIVVTWPTAGPLTWPKRGVGQLTVLPR